YLELFSGDSQSVLDNNKPGGLPFTTPNLAAALIAAGRTFIGYADDLPAAGDASTEMTFYPNGTDRYARKHVPWTNWQSPANPLPPNALPPSVNQPFTAFPTDFNQLPDVAFVIPNELHDMHSGPNRVLRGDRWLAEHLAAYAAWAVQNNSLLIVTWDEDDSRSGNQIPTVFFGAHLRVGENEGAWTLHHLLRTLTDLTGIAPIGRGANVSRIAGIFTDDQPVTTRTFRQGAAYRGTLDILLRESLPDAAIASSVVGSVGIAAGQRDQVLVRFDNILGPDARQLSTSATIISAQLRLQTGANGPDGTTQPVALHRLRQPFNATSTWNSLVGGISTDNVEAAASAEFTAIPHFANDVARFDVTPTLQDFVAGGENDGWLVTLSAADSWRFVLSENLTNIAGRPTLHVTVAASELSLDSALVRVKENAGSVTLKVHRTGALDAPAVCDFITLDGTAVASSDFTEKHATLIWAAGDATDRAIVIPIRNNREIEGRETFTVKLRAPAGIGKLGAIRQTTVVILE
ncbi:MAG: alkaline phosphatase family protein, partial [Chthoniobacteraceae bacterium]